MRYLRDGDRVRSSAGGRDRSSRGSSLPDHDLQPAEEGEAPCSLSDLSEKSPVAPSTGRNTSFKTQWMFIDRYRCLVIQPRCEGGYRW